jgi:DNA segregation ATPase FtsK/SpoIIIE-like protein
MTGLILVQAHRIKTESSVIRMGLLRFAKRVLRELGFWFLAAVALGMMIALVTFSPEDPAWTHTTNVSQFHNLGGAVGAWFADVSLYFFGYPAHLLPLGVIFGGWRLFMRGALLELDGEIVLLRVLGFVVTLTIACGLAALHLRPVPGTIPSTGSAGGLAGVHVSPFLTHAFEFAWGNLFMLFLLLAGVTLATGLSCLTLLDRVGQAALKMAGWIGTLAIALFRLAHPEINNHSSENVDLAGEIAPVSASKVVAPRVRTDPDRRFRQIIEGPLAWWWAWWTPAASVGSADLVKAVDSAPLPIQSPVHSPVDSAPVIEMESLTSRQAMQTEPVFNLLSNREQPRPEHSVTDPIVPTPQVWEPHTGGLETLTLVPTVTPIRTAAASIPSVSPVAWTELATDFDVNEEDVELKVVEVTHTLLLGSHPPLRRPND